MPSLRAFLAGACALCIMAGAAGWAIDNADLNPAHRPGNIIDRLDGVPVFYNGAVGRTQGRNLAGDGYNLGLRWQCVEFVKRYYYLHFGHRMPDASGNAKDFFDTRLKDGEVNRARNLVQYANGGTTAPRPGDIIIFGPWWLNAYGHVAIVSQVGPSSIEIVQQNPGPFAASRKRLALRHEHGRTWVGMQRILGWLHKPDA